MSKVEEILEKFNNWHTNDYTTTKQPEITYIEAVEAINKLLIEAKIEEIKKFIGSSDLAGISNFNGNGLSAAKRRITELQQSLKDK